MGVAVDTRPAVARDRQQAPRNETAAERAEIEVATEISEAGDRSPDLALILRAKQCAQVAIRTDIVFFKVLRADMDAVSLCARLDAYGVRMTDMDPRRVRAVTNYHVTRDDIDATLAAVRKALN